MSKEIAPQGAHLDFRRYFFRKVRINKPPFPQLHATTGEDVRSPLRNVRGVFRKILLLLS